MGKKTIRRYSADDLKAMHERGDYVPTRPDAPTIELDEDFWDKARVVMPRDARSIPKKAGRRDPDPDA